jgi:hypothetical protein
MKWSIKDILILTAIIAFFLGGLIYSHPHPSLIAVACLTAGFSILFSWLAVDIYDRVLLGFLVMFMLLIVKYILLECGVT